MKKYKDAKWLEQQYIALGKSQAAIARDLGCSQRTIGIWLTKSGIPTREKKVFKDITNKRYGSLVVIKFVGRKESNHAAIWQCKCDCGREHTTTLDNLRSGDCKTCSKCNHAGQIKGTQWHAIKRSASRRNLEFLIDINYAWKLFEKQDGKCVLSDIKLAFADSTSDHKLGKTTASLDRIDNKKGYIKGNVQWVHKDINKMRREYEVDYYIEICKKVAEKNK